MFETFIATLNPMITMFLFVFIGFAVSKCNVTPENTGIVLSKVENYIFMPAQVFVTFMTYCTVESLTANYRFTLFSILCIIISLLMGYPLSYLLDRDGKNRGIYRYALVFANYGYLGNSVVPQILGQQYLYPYLLFTLPINMMAYLWGIGQMMPAGAAKTNPFKRLLNPVIIALFAGAIVGLTGAGKLLPAFVVGTLNDLSACMGPVAMILTGFIIGGYDWQELLQDRKVYIMTFLRLTVLPAILLAVAYLLGADHAVLTMILIAFGAALGMNTVIFTAAYGGDTKPGASMAMVSHVGAVITVPLMYALLTQITGG